GSDAEVADTPSTPPRTDEHLITASPAQQQDTRHKKRRRRSSVVQSKEDVSDEIFSSSPFGGNLIADAESSPIRVEDSINSDDDDIDAEGDTAMSVEEGTSQSVASDASGSSTQSSLDERLRR